jgi:hypothetical protein
MVRGAPVLMVETDPARVEQALAAGELACPGCGGVLGGWGWARGGGCAVAVGCGSAFVRVGAAAGRVGPPTCCCPWWACCAAWTRPR